MGETKEIIVPQVEQIGNLLSKEMQRFSAMTGKTWEQKKFEVHGRRELMRDMVKYYDNDPKLSKAKRAKVEEGGLVAKYSRGEAEMVLRFLGAVGAVYDLFGDMDVKAHLDGDIKEEMMVADKGSRANSQLTGFFLRLDQEYNLGSEIFEVYGRVFGEGGLQQETMKGGEPSFGMGVYAMILAYLLLKKDHGNYSWRVASEEEDLGGGGDIVGEGDDGKVIRAEVKASKHIKRIQIYRLQDEKDRETISVDNGQWGRGWLRRQRTLMKALKWVDTRSSEKETFLWVDVPLESSRD